MARPSKNGGRSSATLNKNSITALGPKACRGRRYATTAARFSMPGFRVQISSFFIIFLLEKLTKKTKTLCTKSRKKLSLNFRPLLSSPAREKHPEQAHPEADDIHHSYPQNFSSRR